MLQDVTNLQLEALQSMIVGICGNYIYASSIYRLPDYFFILAYICFRMEWFGANSLLFLTIKTEQEF